MTAYVYILASQKSGALYIGSTANLARRMEEHRQAAIKSFSKSYFVRKLVYVEIYDTLEEALLREKRLKKWGRAWKIELIEKQNPEWADLSKSPAFTSIAPTGSPLSRGTANIVSRESGSPVEAL